MREYEQHKQCVKLVENTADVFFYPLPTQEKNFLQMVKEAGTPGIQKQIVKPENLKGMEAQFQLTLQELANAIKVPADNHSLNV